MKLLGERPETRYTKIPNELITDSKLSNDARLLGIYLLSLPQKDGDYKHNQEQMAAALGWPAKTDRVRKAIGCLVDHGWLRHNELKGPKGNIYGHEYVMHRSRRFHSIPEESSVMDASPIPEETSVVTTEESSVLNKEQKNQETAAAEWPQPIAADEFPTAVSEAELDPWGGSSSETPAASDERPWDTSGWLSIDELYSRASQITYPSTAY